MKKKLALVGFFGWGNFGDELFIKAHEQHLANDYDLVVANDLTKAPYFTRPINSIVSEVDGVLIGGGDLLNPVRVSPLYWNRAYLKKPTFIFGLGVPRQVSVKPHVLKHYEDFLNHSNCKLIVARDVESYTWLKENFGLGDKLKWYPDAVCSLKLPTAAESQEKTLGIVMREHHSLDENMDPLFELIDRGRELGYKIKHIVLANLELGKGDYQRALKIRGEHTDEELIYTEDLDEMCEAISSCDLLATIKFHGMVVATMYGIPSIAMSVTPKNKNFLNMLGIEGMCHSYRSPGLADKLPEIPQPINPETISWLRAESTKGYEILKSALDDEIYVERVDVKTKKARGALTTQLRAFARKLLKR